MQDKAIVAAIKTDWRTAPLESADRSLLRFAEKLTIHPQDMSAADVRKLQADGFDDQAIHDLVQVVSYFNYINRVADGLGTDPEDFFRPRAT